MEFEIIEKEKIEIINNEENYIYEELKDIKKAIKKIKNNKPKINEEEIINILLNSSEEIQGIFPNQKEGLCIITYNFLYFFENNFKFKYQIKFNPKYSFTKGIQTKYTNEIIIVGINIILIFNLNYLMGINN
jgi:hypothetical protein